MRRLPLLLLPSTIIGVWIALTFASVNASPGETGLSALSLWHQGFIGDPYLLPTGPTAHTPPGTDALLAAVYCLFGGNTTGARITLSLMALAQYQIASWVVLRRAGAALRGRWRGLLLLGFTLLQPLFLVRMIISYRQWDQPTSALLLVLLLYVWLTDRRVMPWRSRAIAIGLLGGLGSLFAPILPVVAVIAAAHLAWREADWRTLGLVGACVAVLMTPWLVRNQLVLGAPVLTRSNFGLELAVGNHDASDGHYNLATAPKLHPHDFPDAARHLADVGEVAYMREMGDIAHRWIAAHPARFIELCARRAVLLLFPTPEGDPLYRQGWTPAFYLVSVAGLAALAILARRGRMIVPWVVCVVLPLAPAILTHADLRYMAATFFAQLALLTAGLSCLPLSRWGAGAATAVPRAL